VLSAGGLAADHPGLSINIAVLIALVALVALDWYFDWHAVMALMAPVLLIGGMTMGWFTPTEAAVAAVIWTLFLGLVRYRTMTWRTLAKASFDTIETTASVLFIVTAASIFAWLLTVSAGGAAVLGRDVRADRQLVDLPDHREPDPAGRRRVSGHHRGDLDPGADPDAGRARYGIDPVHLGVMLTLNLMIGLLTPPVGMVLTRNAAGDHPDDQAQQRRHGDAAGRKQNDPSLVHCRLPRVECLSFDIGPQPRGSMPPAAPSGRRVVSAGVAAKRRAF
jgi:hypothetical protein